MHIKDRTAPSFTTDSPKGPLYHYFRVPDISYLKALKEILIDITSHYLEHRFDLLGSGWVRICYGMSCRGLEGYYYKMGQDVDTDPRGRWLKGRINGANLVISQGIWNFVDNNYRPIDWQLDFKSGYRWSEKTWYRNIAYGHKLGVDVKVPWELSRMQHLPQLAWAYALAKEGYKGLKHAQVYANEFRNQVLDFISTNPPRFGVNWVCTMDVGIRVVNWLVAYDFFRAYGAKFDSDFEREFCYSIYGHGLHIINNLEWSPELHGNHYLANIVGLLFVASYLPRTADTDSWLAFAVQELVNEVGSQFTPDGVNYEASTSYHRLSAEMCVYGTALVLGLSKAKLDALKDYDFHRHTVEPTLRPAPTPLYPLQGSELRAPFPAWYYERLEKMAEFTIHITKPNNKIAQIGDNDSGRFLKLHPLYKKMTVKEARKRYLNLEGYYELPDEDIYWDESFLDHRHLIAAINGLFNREDFERFTGPAWFENALIHDLSGGRRIRSYKGPDEAPDAEKTRIEREDEWMRIQKECDALTGYVSKTTNIPFQGGHIKANLRLYGYPDFGLFIFKSERFYLLIRCGPVGQNGIGGHAHNDQLSIELNIDVKDRIVDPGTYLYTPLPEYRNAYRSMKAHFAPQVEDGREPGRLDLGLFQLGDEAKAKCVYFGKNGFVGVHWGYGEPVYRIIKFLKHGLQITDYTKEGRHLKGASVKKFVDGQTLKAIDFSKGYGVRIRQLRE